MTQAELPRDYYEKRAWLHLQQDLLEAGPEEINVELSQVELRGSAPFGLSIEMNDSRSRNLDVIFHAKRMGFVLADARLQRFRHTGLEDVLDVCKSWMFGTENVKLWPKIDRRHKR